MYTIGSCSTSMYMFALCLYSVMKIKKRSRRRTSCCRGRRAGGCPWPIKTLSEISKSSSTLPSSCSLPLFASLASLPSPSIALFSEYLYLFRYPGRMQTTPWYIWKMRSWHCPEYGHPCLHLCYWPRSLVSLGDHRLHDYHLLPYPQNGQNRTSITITSITSTTSDARCWECPWFPRSCITIRSIPKLVLNMLQDWRRPFIISVFLECDDDTMFCSWH